MGLGWIKGIIMIKYVTGRKIDLRTNFWGQPLWA